MPWKKPEKDLIYLNQKKEPTEEEKEKAKKLCDPEGTGKINFEGFRRLSLAIIEEGKKRGKL